METSRPKAKAYKFDNFLLDVGNRELLRDSVPVALSGKAFDMLVALVEGRGQLISKDELFSRVWPNQIVEESNLTVQVSAIRKVLGDRSGSPRYLVTIPGHGYKFIGSIADFHVEEEETVIEHHSLSRVTIETEGMVSDAIDRFVLTHPEQIIARRESLLPTQSEQHRSLRVSFASRWLFLVIGLMVLVTAGFVFYRQVRSSAAVFPFESIGFKRLTNSRTVRDAVLSPDGKLFAYEYTANEGWQRSLWLGHVDGGESIQLIPPAAATYSSMTFSRDSGSLYFIVSNQDHPSGALFRIPVFGGVAEKLRDNINNRVSFSPDMKRFVYVKDERNQGRSSLMIENISNGPATTLVTRPVELAFLSGPAWSMDGGKIAVGAINQSGSATSREVFLVSVADGRIVQLTNHHFGMIRNIAWLKDGSGLVMVAKEDSAANAQLWYLSVADGAMHTISPDSYDYGVALSTSDDGNTLLALQTQTLANIWVGPADHLDQAKRVTSGSIGRREGLYGLDWTPDDQIAFAAFEDRNEMLWEMAADGSNQKQLTPAGHVDENPSVTADGRYLVFESDRSGSTEIWRVDRVGGNLQQLTNGGNNKQPGVSPAGKWVVYVSSQQALGPLWRVSLLGGEPTRLNEGQTGWPRVSPDGKLVACAFSPRGESSEVSLAILPIDGGKPIHVFKVPSTANFRYGVRWTPDGLAITYRDWFNGIWRQSLVGGDLQRLPGLPAEKIFSYGWSHDGKEFAFSRGSEIRDIVLIQNLK